MPDYGKILVDGQNPSNQKLCWEKLRSRMGVTFQFPEDMFFQESISEEFWKILGEKGHSKKDVERLSHNAMKWIGLDANNLWSKHPFHLSQGQLRQLSLALVWAQDWDLLLMDEPTVGLDCLLKGKILKDLLQRCHQHDKLCIITGHDTSTLLPLVDYGIILDKGEIVLYDTREKILQKSDCLSSVGLSMPPLADLSIKLKKNGLPINQIWKDQGQAIRDLIAII
jgi:energy-coupling factor transport system ATP-binding protein